jgi:hypothetical protein
MTGPPLQTNKVWAVMLYSNSGDVIGGVRTATLPASPERRYALREIKARFAPSIFSRCRPECLQRSLCDLPSAEPRLLDAAHIIMDAGEQLGQPVISNGYR